MDVAAEFVIHSKLPRHFDKLLHGVIDALYDSGTQKKSLDVVPPVELDGELDHFGDGKPGARHVARNSSDTVRAIVDAVVRQQNFEQRNAAAVRSNAVENVRGRRVAQSARNPETARFTTSAGGVVFDCIRQNVKLGREIHSDIDFRLANKRRKRSPA